jgi:hypothetical protein
MGFWIWCEVISGNPYQEECKGAVYFYDLGLVRAVEENESLPPTLVGSSATMWVESEDGRISCMLRNPNPPTRGPTNLVNVACSTPARAGDMVNVVVKITGP